LGPQQSPIDPPPPEPEIRHVDRIPTADATRELGALRRAPPAQVKRSGFTTRLSDEMLEWLRVTAFLERRSVQEVVEEAIDFYRNHYPRA
jgi:hypothetical protein